MCAGHGNSHQEGGTSNLSRLKAFLSNYRVLGALTRFGGERDRGGPQAQAHVWMSEDDVFCSGGKTRAGSALGARGEEIDWERVAMGRSHWRAGWAWSAGSGGREGRSLGRPARIRRPVGGDPRAGRETRPGAPARPATARPPSWEPPATGPRQTALQPPAGAPNSAPTWSLKRTPNPTRHILQKHFKVYS